ncbi:MAG: hypothetical protein H6828_07390 [Planctomycetes bacterium]|nr:hypothetical protein [Planctomycetota bacterium]
MDLRLALPLVAALAAGCSSTRVAVTSSTSPGQVSEVRVLGDAPRVRVSNLGPGDLRVELDSPDDTADVTLELGQGSLRREAPGPLLLRLVPLGRREANWRVEAWNCTGLHSSLVEAHGASVEP